MNVNFSKYFNLSSLSQEQQAAFINAMTELILARFADMIGDHLSEQEITELEQLSQSNDSQAILQWLDKHIPNMSQGIDEILKEESQSIATSVTTITELALGEQSDAGAKH